VSPEPVPTVCLRMGGGDKVSPPPPTRSAARHGQLAIQLVNLSSLFSFANLSKELTVIVAYLNRDILSPYSFWGTIPAAAGDENSGAATYTLIFISFPKYFSKTCSMSAFPHAESYMHQLRHIHPVGQIRDRRRREICAVR
jgi:hypothetical protein